MSSFLLSRLWTRPSIVALLYLAATLVMTWPLVTVMDHRIAGDMGDPLFNCWILLWTGGQVLQFLRGDLSALSHYWSGNIFYPAPLTLAYSEHLTPQMLQTLPILAASSNVILAYNAVLLGTFVLSGLGMYLLVRELTGQPLAAFLAGLACAFAPYRIDQYSHLEVLSSQWMPFALYGFRRFFVTERLRALVGGASALVVQALSCAYYMAYFTPCAVAYCLYELIVRGRLRDGRAWRALAGVGGVSLVALGVFLWPYVRVRQMGEVGFRDLARVQSYAFDTHAFATITPNSRLLGSLVNAMVRNEGQGFPGFTILVFVVIALGAWIADAVLGARGVDDRTTWWRRALAVLCGVLLVLMLWTLGGVLVNGETTHRLMKLFALRRDPATRLAGYIVIVCSALLLLEPRVRRIARGAAASLVGFFFSAALVATALCLGPMMYANGRPIGAGLYNVLYRWVPGFDGLRVPSLNAMIASVFLSLLAGLGAAALIGRWRRVGRLLVVLGMIAILAESWSVPTDTNVRFHGAGYAWPSAEIDGPRRLTPIYRRVRDLPVGTVIAEFPFGDSANEIRYVFYSGYHRKPLVNGYSGFYPENYQRVLEPLSNVPTSDDAWNALISTGATHAIVHEGGYLDRDGREVSAWLRRHGAKEMADSHPDHLFHLRE